MPLAPPVSKTARLQVIEALDGQLITNRFEFVPRVENGAIVSDVVNDVLKLVVVNRYSKAPPAIAFITTAMRADAGVVISASHNPFGDNGIKFFDHTGFKLPDELELKLVQSLAQFLRGKICVVRGVSL